MPMRQRSRRSLPELPPERRRVDLVGFHGHTLFHRPEQRRTCQLGDGQRLADRLGIDVVYDFRSADVAAGGQGAPLAPVYHQALAAALERPVAILNLGGVGNFTWIGDGRADRLRHRAGQRPDRRLGAGADRPVLR